MSTRRYALLFGVIFLLIGVAGFLPGLWHPASEHFPPMRITSFYGEAIIFPVNVLHNIVHMAFGLWGLAASRKLASARSYARTVAITYFALTIAGFVPGLNIMFGLVPLFQNDIWLHALLALLGAYFGWLRREAEPWSPAEAAHAGADPYLSGSSEQHEQEAIGRHLQ